MKSLFNSCCMNWKVMVGLAAVGLGVWIVAPGLVASVAPLLIVALCPLSMLFMMGGMRGDQQAAHSAGATPSMRVSQADDLARPREEQLAALQARLSSVHVQHDAISRAIARLEAARGAPEASETVARRAVAPVSERA